MVLPELHACGFSKFEHVIKKEFNALPAKYVHHIDITARKFFLTQDQDYHVIPY
jgi:hypothetical protein